MPLQELTKPIMIEQSSDDAYSLIMAHQQEAIDAMTSYFEPEKDLKDRNGLVVMPTGSGKTYTAVHWVLSQGIARGYRVLWLLDCKKQVEDLLQEFGKQAFLLEEIDREQICLRLMSDTAIFSQSQLDENDVSTCPADEDLNNDVTFGADVCICPMDSLTDKEDCRSFLELLAGETTDSMHLMVVVDDARRCVDALDQKALKRISKVFPNRILLGLTSRPRCMKDAEQKRLQEIYSIDRNRLKNRGTHGFVYEVRKKNLLTSGFMSHQPAFGERPTYPCGWFPVMDENGKHHPLLVFEFQLEGYRALERNLKLVRGQASVKDIHSLYFAEVDLKPDAEKLGLLLDYIDDFGQMPAYYSFQQKERFDCHQEGSFGFHQEEAIASDTAESHDLMELLEEVRRMYPRLRTNGLMKIAWSKRPEKSWFGQCHRDLIDDKAIYQITINNILCSPEVDREVIKYLIYHELLHENGHWKHDKEFRKLEHRYPQYEAIDNFLDSMWIEYRMEKIQDKVSFGDVSAAKTLEPLDTSDFFINANLMGCCPMTRPQKAQKAEMKFCSGCGSKLTEGSRFCSHCGVKIK